MRAASPQIACKFYLRSLGRRSINTAKRERDNRMLKVRCAQGIKGLPFDLLQVPSRAYVREGTDLLGAILSA